MNQELVWFRNYGVIHCVLSTELGTSLVWTLLGIRNFRFPWSSPPPNGKKKGCSFFSISYYWVGHEYYYCLLLKLCLLYPLNIPVLKKCKKKVGHFKTVRQHSHNEKGLLRLGLFLKIILPPLWWEQELYSGQSLKPKPINMDNTHIMKSM